MANVLYYSPGCPNSVRLIQALSELPELARSFRLVDVAVASPQERARLSHVPTIVRHDGAVLVGSKCFEFLAQHQGEKDLVELPAPGFASDVAPFSYLDDFGGSATTMQNYCALDDFHKNFSE